MIDREAHSLLNASHSVLPTEEYIYSIQDKTEIEHLIDRLSKLRQLYIHDVKLHGQIENLYHLALGRDFHLYMKDQHGVVDPPDEQAPPPVNKALLMLDDLISKADGEGTFRGGKDPAELQQMREDKRQEAEDAGGELDVEKGYPVNVDHRDFVLQHKGQATHHQKMANASFETHVTAMHQKAADSHVVAIQAHNKALKDPKFADQARAATETAYDHGQAADRVWSGSGRSVAKADPGEEQGSFRGGDPEELQRKREEKRTEALESGQAEDDQGDQGDAGEEPDPAVEQAEQEKKEMKEQSKSMGADMDHGIGTGQRSAEVSPVDTFGDYDPRDANGDPVHLKARATEQGYHTPGPIRQGKNQHKDWSEVIGIKVPMVSPIQELRRYYGAGDGAGADRSSKMMPKSMIASMIKAVEGGEAPPAAGGGGSVPEAGAEGRARGGKYVKREFRNGRWDYTYQEDMHQNHGPGNLNNPDGHSLQVHQDFKGGSPEEAFHHSLHMHAAEGGDHPIKLWNDDTNQHEDKLLHFPGSEKDEEGKHVIDPKTGLPKLDDRKTAIIRNPGQKTGGDRVAGMQALHKKTNPVVTIKDAHGDPWIHVKMPVGTGKKKEGALRPQADKPLIKYDTRSRFTHPDDVRRGYDREWRAGGTGSMQSVIDRLEKEKGLQEFLKQEETKGSTSMADREKAKDWAPTHHEVWDMGTGNKKRDEHGQPVMAEDKNTNAIERGGLGQWKWNDEDRGYDVKNEHGETTRHYVKRGKHLSFDSHESRNKVMADLLGEHYGKLVKVATNMLRERGQLKGSDHFTNGVFDLINHAWGHAFHNAVDSFDPSRGARLSTHIVNRASRAMQDHLPQLMGEEGQNILQRRRDVRGFRPKTDTGFVSSSESGRPGEEGSGDVTEPRSRRGRSAGHGLVEGGIGGMIGSGRQLRPDEKVQFKNEIQDRDRRGELSKEEMDMASEILGSDPTVSQPEAPPEPEKPAKPSWLGQAPARKEPAGPAAPKAPGKPQSYVSGHSDPSYYEPQHGQPDEDEDYGGGRGGRFRRALVDLAASTLFKAMDDEEPPPDGGVPQPKYLWREGEPGAQKHMWEAPNGDVVRMTNAPEGHPHHDPENGPPMLHPNEPTPESAPHMFDKHGRKLHRPAPDGVETEHNDHYDPDVNSWAQRYQDPETGDDEHVYLHRDRVKDHRLKFNEDLRHMDAQLEKVRQWYKQLLKTNDPVHRAIGLAVVFMDQAKMVSDGTDSGILSMKVGDVKPSGNTISFTYRDAKGGAHHVQAVVDSTVGSVLQELMQDKKPSDPLFAVHGQQIEQPMLAKIFDDQFGISPNHLRVFHGTEMFSKEFQNQAATTPNLEPEHLPKIANKTYSKVARMMGHLTMSPKLAQQMYVDPVAVEALYMSSVHHHHPDFNKSQNHGEVSRMVFQGIPISIENTVGSVREWHDKHTGETGKIKMLYPYGYIRNTTGTDDDEVDVYVGPHRNSDRVFVVHQMKGPTFKEYDEDKCMLGFRTAHEAREAYLKHYDDPRFFGSMSAMPVREFKNKVFSTKKHPHMVTSDKISGGRADGKSDTEFDPDQVLDGIKVEMEHTNDPSIAYEITKDHLTESKDYYRKLKKMEKELEKSFQPHRPSGSTESEPGYVYHATNEDRAHDMAGGHLKTHKPWEHTDQGVWPDGSTEKRSYWSHKAGSVHFFAPEEGKSVILRTKQADHFKKESGTGDTFTTKKVHSDNLEIKHEDGSWHPLNQTYGSVSKSAGQWQPDPYVWHVSVSNPDRTAEEEAFSKWVHSHPMHEHDQQWAAFKLATKVPDVPIPDPHREYADGSKQLLDNVADNPHMEQEEAELTPPTQGQVAKSMIEVMIQKVA
jgi:hypothetical protein